MWCPCLTLVSAGVQNGGADLDAAHVAAHVVGLWGLGYVLLVQTHGVCESTMSAALACSWLFPASYALRCRPSPDSPAVKFLWDHRDVLGLASGISLEELGLSDGACLSVTATTPAIVAFDHMAVDHKSSVAIVDEAGKLIGNLSVRVGSDAATKFAAFDAWSSCPGGFTVQRAPSQAHGGCSGAVPTDASAMRAAFSPHISFTSAGVLPMTPPLWLLLPA